MADSIFAELSQELVGVRERAARSIVQVHGRGQRPASGVALGSDSFLVAAHTVTEGEDVAVRFEGEQASGTVVGLDSRYSVGVVRAPGIAASPVEETKTGPVDGALGIVMYRNMRGLVRSSIVTLDRETAPLPLHSYGRSLESVLRTDFEPVTGWSGGLLLGADGLPMALLNGGLIRGSGLAVPLDAALAAARAIQSHGSPRRGWMGIASQPVELPERQRAGRSSETGLVILQVSAASPAEQAGLLVGDVVISFDGVSVPTPDALLSQLTGDRVGRSVPVEVIRGGELRVLQVHVSERPRRR